MVVCYVALTCASDKLLYLPILQRENNFGSHPFCEFQITNMISEEVFVTKSESATILSFLKRSLMVAKTHLLRVTWELFNLLKDSRYSWLNTWISTPWHDIWSGQFDFGTLTSLLMKRWPKFVCLLQMLAPQICNPCPALVSAKVDLAVHRSNCSSQRNSWARVSSTKDWARIIQGCLVSLILS